MRFRPRRSQIVPSDRGSSWSPTRAAKAASPGASPRPRALCLAAAALIGLLLPALAAAQSVSGRVLDERSGTPIPEAAVALVDEAGAVAASARTDQDGRFHLDAAAPGRYRVRVEALGYAATTEREIVVEDRPLLIRLLVEPAALEAEGITVRVEQPGSRFPGRQVISGKVLDAASDEPIDGMEVLARHAGGRHSGRTLTDRDGRFFIVVESAGLYHLAVARFGYDSTSTAAVAVAPDQDLYGELRVQPVARGIRPIRVTAPRTIPYLESTGFYGRMRRGHGSFFTSRDLERMPAAFPTQILRRIAGVTVRRGEVTMRGITGFMGAPCRPTIVLDGMFMRGIALDDLVHANDIEALEVYKGPSTVPPQWRGAAVCGVIAVWTKH